MMVLYAALFGYDELMRVIGKANKSQIEAKKGAGMSITH